MGASKIKTHAKGDLGKNMKDKDQGILTRTTSAYSLQEDILKHLERKKKDKDQEILTHTSSALSPYKDILQHL